MKPHILRIVDGPEKGRTFELSDGQTLVVGRGTASHTQINDPRVSRVHCEVSHDRGQTTVKAAENAGQVTLHGQPVEQSQLQPGEVFCIGDTYIRLDAAEQLEASTMQGGTVMDSLIGTEFAHYRLSELLRRGASGVVYRAEDTKHAQTVAVKVLLPAQSRSEAQRERFVRAMRTMLPIRHPNLIRLVGAGKKGPFCWVAMEWIDGESMAEVIERLGVRNMLDWRKVWEVAIDIGRALQCAAEHNIVHRNLAPTNILYRSSDRVSLLGDLMLAKATDGQQSFDVTAPGQIVGDIAYMSPERTHSNCDLDARSDIYELGATLYALLTGRPPFEANSPIEHIQQIREQTPVPPKEYQLSVNDQFQRIVMAMLAKRPDDRPASATDLLDDLQRVGTFAGLTRPSP